MSKIKLLFDGQIFVASQKTGIYRVATNLLKKLLKEKDIDLYIAKSTKNGNLIDCLKQNDLFDNLKDKIISMPNLVKTTRTANLYHRLRAIFFRFVSAYSYSKKLRKFDAYFSVFHPISPIVYNNVKTFLMIHDVIPLVCEESCSKKYKKTFKDRLLNAHPNAYFCVSKYTKYDFLKFKPNATPIYITYLAAGDNFHPVDDKKTINKTMEKYGIKTKKYFLGVSEITKRKNFAHLLDAFVEFLNNTKSNDISLVIVGPKRPSYDEVSEKIEKLIKKYPGKIVLTGFVDDEDMAPLYAGATSFIYPSLYEGFGLPILEAMKCGTPVICADNTSLPEVAGKAALYISGYDIKETASTLEKVYKDKILVGELRQKGLEQAKKFDWQKTADIIINTMKNMIK